MSSEHISRRDFLKAAGIIGVAAFLSSCDRHEVLIPSQVPTTQPKPTETPITTLTPTRTVTLTPAPTETATLAPTETEHFTTPKILLMGDSMLAITTVPTDLADLFEKAGIPVEFVGDITPPGSSIPTDGLGGFNTLLMLRQLTRETVWTELNGTRFPNNISKHIPDIVVVQLGTNDAINSFEGKWNPVPIYCENMKSIVKFLRLKNPSVKIIIPMLIPSEWSDYTAKIDLINSAVPDLVKSLDEPDSRVVTTANLKSGWQFSDFSDNVHPNSRGAQKMAKAYFDAFMENQLILKSK